MTISAIKNIISLESGRFLGKILGGKVFDSSLGRILYCPSEIINYADSKKIFSEKIKWLAPGIGISLATLAGHALFELTPNRFLKGCVIGVHLVAIEILFGSRVSQNEGLVENPNEGVPKNLINFKDLIKSYIQSNVTKKEENKDNLFKLMRKIKSFSHAIIDKLETNNYISEVKTNLQFLIDQTPSVKDFLTSVKDFLTFECVAFSTASFAIPFFLSCNTITLNALATGVAVIIAQVEQLV